MKTRYFVIARDAHQFDRFLQVNRLAPAEVVRVTHQAQIEGVRGETLCVLPTCRVHFEMRQMCEDLKLDPVEGLGDFMKKAWAAGPVPARIVTTDEQTRKALLDYGEKLGREE